MVRWIALKFVMMTHVEPLEPSDGQKFDFEKEQHGGWLMSRHVRSRYILKATQQEVEPTLCMCR